MTETSIMTHAELTDRLAEVEQERDELAAMVECIQKAWANAGGDIEMLFYQQPKNPNDGSHLVDGQSCTELDVAINAKPPTALRHMHDERNQAIQQAVRAARRSWVVEDQQAIRELKAEAVEAFASWCLENTVIRKPFIENGAHEYAQQLRTRRD